MLAGLFRLRQDGCGECGLTQLMWKQVWWCFSPTMVFEFICVSYLRKGVIWLFVATIAEVLPVVSHGRSSFLLFGFIFMLRTRCSFFRI
jgi:hypothetical protein